MTNSLPSKRTCLIVLIIVACICFSVLFINPIIREPISFFAKKTIIASEIKPLINTTSSSLTSSSTTTISSSLSSSTRGSSSTLSSTILTGLTSTISTTKPSSPSPATLNEFEDDSCISEMEKNNGTKSLPACNQSRCAVILRRSGGRLGNRMFMFASAYGLARSHDCRLHVSESILNELKNNFQLVPISENMWLSDREVASMKDIVEKSTVCTFLPELLKPNAFRHIELRGYWQSYMYFDAYREEIRAHFTGRSETLVTLAAFFFEITKDKCDSCTALPHKSQEELRRAIQTRGNITWVGIHIRRADFLGIGYASGDKYVRRAIAYFQRRHGRDHVRFIVASDDKGYCRQLFAAQILSKIIIIIPNQFSSADDLIALALCHHTIVTGGTFGFWAAYLAGGEVVHDNVYKAVCSRWHYYPPWFMLVGETIEKREKRSLKSIFHW